MRLRNAIDGAKYVEYIDDRTFAVWTGGHGINVYHEYPTDGQFCEVTEVDYFNVGSFEYNEASLQEVKEGIKAFS